jgi:hypothetical protein
MRNPTGGSRRSVRSRESNDYIFPTLPDKGSDAARGLCRSAGAATPADKCGHATGRIVPAPEKVEFAKPTVAKKRLLFAF